MKVGESDDAFLIIKGGEAQSFSIAIIAATVGSAFVHKFGNQR